MSELLTNTGATAWPYLVVVLLCVFWLLGSGLQSRASNDGKKAGPHAAWRVSEGPASVRRFWQRKKRRS
ncbi:MAG: hypothetical protein JNL06_14615 [Alphaproteobacteria bacterium]|nr:hypothetical protein [Alphaproteobacteria bacterium]